MPQSFTGIIKRSAEGRVYIEVPERDAGAPHQVDMASLLAANLNLEISVSIGDVAPDPEDVERARLRRLMPPPGPPPRPMPRNPNGRTPPKA